MGIKFARGDEPLGALDHLDQLAMRLHKPRDHHDDVEKRDKVVAALTRIEVAEYVLFRADGNWDIDHPCFIVLTSLAAELFALAGIDPVRWAEVTE